MKLPNLSEMDVSKKMAMAIAGAYFVKDIADIYTACLVTGLLITAIVCQTAIDVKIKRKEVT